MRQVHVDSTSFAVGGEYAPDPDDQDTVDAHSIAVTYGYSRDFSTQGTAPSAGDYRHKKVRVVPPPRVDDVLPPVV